MSHGEQHTSLSSLTPALLRPSQWLPGNTHHRCTNVWINGWMCTEDGWVNFRHRLSADHRIMLLIWAHVGLAITHQEYHVWHLHGRTQWCLDTLCSMEYILHTYTVFVCREYTENSAENVPCIVMFLTVSYCVLLAFILFIHRPCLQSVTEGLWQRFISFSFVGLWQSVSNRLECFLTCVRILALSVC